MMKSAANSKQLIILKTLFSKQLHQQKMFAGIVVEAVQGGRWLYSITTKIFLKELRRICNENGISF